MKPTDGMQRGMSADDLGEPISVPVGPERSAACSTCSASRSTFRTAR
jgi:F0F1-type ATP synthase beta subunit